VTVKELIHAIRKTRDRLKMAEPRLVKINQNYAGVLADSKQVQEEEIGEAILGRHHQQVAEAHKTVEDSKWELTKARRETLEELRVRGLTDAAAQQAHEIISNKLVYPTVPTADRIIRLLEGLRLPEVQEEVRQRLRDEQIDALAEDPQELASRLQEALNSKEHNLKSAAGAMDRVTEKTLARVRDGKRTHLGTRRHVAKFLLDNSPNG